MKKSFTLISILLFAANLLFAQNGKITGTILDADTKEPLTGASVKYEKTKGAVADASGRFKMEIAAGEHEIVVSYIGYKTEKRKVTVKADETVQLEFLLNSSTLQINQVFAVSQYNKNAAKETVSAAVIGADQIKNTNALDLSEVVNKTPGVLVQDGQISIRGASSYSYGVGSRTLVLQDGVPLMSADLGEVQSNMAALSNVKQVEIVKGASSVVYGSGAVNGVINVLTAWPTDAEPVTEVSTNFTIYDKPLLKYQLYSHTPPLATNLNFNHAERKKNLQFIVAANFTGIKSYLETNDQFRMQALFKLRYLNPKIEGLNYGLGGSIQYEHSDRFFISKDLDSNAFALGKGSNDEYIRTSITPFINYQDTKGDKVKLDMGYINLFRNGQGTDPDAVSHQFYFLPQYQYRWKNMVTVTAGLPFDVSSSRSNLYSGQNLTFHAAAYTQVEFTYKFLTLQGGLRYEASGVDTTYIVKMPPLFRAGINIQAAKATFFRASWGQGYRIPTIGEKYIAQQFTGGILIVPNDTLRAETSWNLELGFQQGFKIGKWIGFFDAAFFWQESKNLIEYELGTWKNRYNNGTKVFPDSLEFVPGSGVLLGLKPLNIENTRIAGYEIGLTGMGNIGPVGLRINAGYTYTWAGKQESADTTHYSTGEFIKDLFKYNFKRVGADDTSKILQDRIRHLVRADIELSYWKCYLGVTFAYASYPEKIPPLFNAAAFFIFHDINALDAYGKLHEKGDFVIDIRAGMKINDHFKVGFIVKNIGDRYYSLRPGKPEALRNFTLQMTYKF